MLKKLGRLVYVLTPFFITAITVGEIRQNHQPEPAVRASTADSRALLADVRPARTPQPGRF